MTAQGAATKTLVLLGLCAITSILSWVEMQSSPQRALIGAMVGAVVGVIISLTLYFKQTWAPFLAPIYAACQGLFLGAISSIYATNAAGTKLGGATGNMIVLSAATLTFSILFAMLLAYKSGLIRATDTFKRCVIAATGGICLFFLASFLLSLFGVNLGMLRSGPIGIGISLFIVVIASLNLVLDFDFIETGEESGAPKYMEWYAAFGLMVTLVWLYLEILRLLAMLNKQR